MIKSFNFVFQLVLLYWHLLDTAIVSHRSKGWILESNRSCWSVIGRNLCFDIFNVHRHPCCNFFIFLDLFVESLRHGDFDLLLDILFVNYRTWHLCDFLRYFFVNILLKSRGSKFNAGYSNTRFKLIQRCHRSDRKKSRNIQNCVENSSLDISFDCSQRHHD